MNLGSVDLNLLVALHVLLDERSVTRAAARVGVSQPAMSHSLARLRTLFSDQLLVRTPAGMVPTHRALSLATPLAAALEAIERTLHGDAPFDPRTARRSFVVSSGDFSSLLLLPPLLQELQTEAPGIDLAIRTTVPDDPVTQLAEGKIDLAIGRYDQDRAGLLRQNLFKERFVCVVRKDHPIARAQRLDIEKWCALNHLLVAPRGTPGSIVDDELARKGRSRRIVLTVPQFLVAPFVVARTDLVWTAPERMALLFATMLPLVVRPSPLDIEGFSISQLWHERHNDDPGHRWLRSRIAAAVRPAPTALRTSLSSRTAPSAKPPAASRSAANRPQRRRS